MSDGGQWTQQPNRTLITRWGTMSSFAFCGYVALKPSWICRRDQVTNWVPGATGARGGAIAQGRELARASRQAQMGRRQSARRPSEQRSSGHISSWHSSPTPATLHPLWPMQAVEVRVCCHISRLQLAGGNLHGDFWCSWPICQMLDILMCKCNSRAQVSEKATWQICDVRSVRVLCQCKACDAQPV
jgi:hypothetical protein